MKLVGLFVSLLVFALPTFAVEPLSTNDLIAQCAEHERDPASLNTARCRSYLHGYMGGAYAMGTVHLQSDSETRKSDFVERAQRTRVGESRRGFGQDRRAGYCVPRELTISELVARSNRFAAKTEKRAESANAFVLAFLSSEFACKNEKS